MNMIYRTYILVVFLFIALPTATAADAKAGKLIFDRVCVHCHAIGGDSKFAPNLKGIGERRDIVWLNKWLKSPKEVLKYDEYAQKLLENNAYSLTMPTFPSMKNDEKRANVIAYLLDFF
ncbi:MAG: c-type cytochrome [Mariprofundaceae bacterium]|nr:c-type cytochrome [Mariprofundaceae bacterium]